MNFQHLAFTCFYLCHFKLSSLVWACCWSLVTVICNLWAFFYVWFSELWGLPQLKVQKTQVLVILIMVEYKLINRSLLYRVKYGIVFSKFLTNLLHKRFNWTASFNFKMKNLNMSFKSQFAYWYMLNKLAWRRQIA